MTRDLAPVNTSAPQAMRTLAEKLRECMRKAGYTVLRDLARDANLSASTVSDALSGTRIPKRETVFTVLKACDVRPSQSWAELYDQAKAAEAEWRQTGGPAFAPDARLEPGTASIRPPIGRLPGRVRGRDQVLTLLAGQLADPRPAVQVLHGLGGCGKTTVALELTRQAAESGHVVFWITADQRDQLIAGMREVAKEIGVPEEEIEESWAGRASAPDLLWRYLDAAQRPWVLVVDNADTPGLLAAQTAEPGDGTGWVRSSSKGVTVVTTRAGSPEIWGSGAQLHHIAVLDADDAAEVLIDLAGHAGDRADALGLADRLGGLPLALMYAGTYLRRTGRGAGMLRRSGSRSERITTFDAYQRALGDIGPALLDQGRPHTENTEGLERLHRRLISRTWEMSLDLLEAQGIPHARALMRLVSCFAPVPLPADLIDVDTMITCGVLPPATLIEDVDRAIDALVDFHIVDVAETDELTAVPEGMAEPPLPCLVGHRLVLEATAARLRTLPEADQRAVWRAAASLLEVAGGPVPEEPWNWDWWQLIAPHVKAAVAAVPDSDEDVLVRVLGTGLRCLAYMAFSERPDDIRSLVELMSARSAVLSCEHPTRLSIRHRELYVQNMDHPLNTADYQAVLEDQIRVLGPDHPETLITRHDSVSALANTHGWAEAEPLMREVAEARTRVLGPVDPYTLLSRIGCAATLVQLGRVDEGEAELRAVVYDCRLHRGAQDRTTLIQVAFLAEVMRVRGHHEEATVEYQHLVENYGSDKPLDGTGLPEETRHQIAHMLDEQERYAEAEAEYRAILPYLRESGQVANFRGVSRSLARNLRAQARYEEAVVLLAELIASCGDLARDDQSVLSIRHQYGDTLMRAERHAEAEAEITAVLAIRAETAAADDSVTLRERHCRAHVLEKLGRNEEAEIELREVAAMFRDLLGNEDKPARDATWCHAMNLYDSGRFSDALPEFEMCLSAELVVFDSDDRTVLISRRRIAETRFMLGLTSRDELVAEFDALLPKMIEHDGQDGKAVKAMREFLAKNDRPRPGNHSAAE